MHVARTLKNLLYCPLRNQLFPTLTLLFSLSQRGRSWLSVRDSVHFITHFFSLTWRLRNPRNSFSLSFCCLVSEKKVHFLHFLTFSPRCDLFGPREKQLSSGFSRSFSTLNNRRSSLFSLSPVICYFSLIWIFLNDKKKSSFGYIYSLTSFACSFSFFFWWMFCLFCFCELF